MKNVELTVLEIQPDGSIMGYYGNAFSGHRGLGQRGNLRVPRKVLRRILLEQLQCTKVYWGHQVVDYEFNSGKSQYTVHFSAGSGVLRKLSAAADLLVAADGIRSSILSKIYQQYPQNNAHEISDEDELSTEVASLAREAGRRMLGPHEMGLRFTNVRLILGIADFTHPLLYERGFYTLDGKHRLFTMPYTCSRFDKSKNNRIMWQLSFAMNDRSMPLDPKSLHEYAVTTCRSWHVPVGSMIQATPMEKIWGTYVS
jgi:2-polyprenyl-6-methoxyphenol hydroxylase-like FAD-dependent oxidoreductase